MCHESDAPVGFIEGGDLTGIISMKALDRSKTSKKIAEFVFSTLIKIRRG